MEEAPGRRALGRHVPEAHNAAGAVVCQKFRVPQIQSGVHKADEEAYIDQSSQRGRSVVVCAAGNEGSGAHHFRGRLVENETLDAEFTVSTQRPQIYLSLWKN